MKDWATRNRNLIIAAYLLLVVTVTLLLQLREAGVL